MSAPMVFTSTIQPMAARPAKGTGREISIKNRMAFRGLEFLSSRPNHSGRMPSWVMEYIRRLAAMQLPTRPVMMAAVTVTPSSASPPFPMVVPTA